MASTYTNLIYHIVFSTKFRRSTIATDWQPQLYEYFGGILREREGICLQIGGMPDHVHILAKRFGRPSGAQDCYLVDGALGASAPSFMRSPLRG